MGAEPHVYPPGPCDGLIQLRFVDERGETLAENTARVSSAAIAFEFAPSREGDHIGRVAPLLANVEVYKAGTGETLFVLAGK